MIAAQVLRMLIVTLGMPPHFRFSEMLMSIASFGKATASVKVGSKETFAAFCTKVRNAIKLQQAYAHDAGQRAASPASRTVLQIENS